jgi:beta-galactosidase
MKDSIFYFGSQYYRTPHPKPILWEKDFKFIRDFNIQFLRVWICWSDISKKEDSYDYNIFDSLFELASKHNLKILIQFILDSAPQWIETKHPEWLCEDKYGNKIYLFAHPAQARGGHPGTCIDNEIACNLRNEFIIKTVERYKDHNSLYAWDLWNEMWRPFCYCEYTTSKYHNFLHKKYKDINNLNKAWNRDYSDFKEIKIPRINIGLREGIDLNEFKRWRVYKDLENRRQVVEKVDKKHLITAHTSASCVEEETGEYCLIRKKEPIAPLLPELMKDYSYPFDDDWAISKHIDILGTSSYLKDLWKTDLRFTCTRSASKNNKWLLAENTGSSIGLGNHAIDTTIEQIKSSNLLAIANGGVGSFFWQWRAEIFGEEAPNYGMISSSGEFRNGVKAIQQLNKLFIKNKNIFSDINTKKAKIAIIWDPKSYLLDKVIYKDRKVETYGSANLFGYFKSITSLGFNVDFLNTECILSDKIISSDYKLLIAPYQVINWRNLNKIFKKWVADGGILLTGPQYGAYSENFYYEDPVPKEMEEFFGVKYIESSYIKIPKIDLVEFDGVSKLYGYNILETYKLSSAIPVGLFGNKVCFTKNHYEKGQVFLIGSFIGKSYMQGANNNLKLLIKKIINEAQIELDFSFSDNNLLIKNCYANNKNLIFCFNTEDKEKTVFLNIKKLFSNLIDLENKKVKKINNHIYCFDLKSFECRLFHF